MASVSREPLDWTAERAIEQVCTEFEDACHARSEPELERYLGLVSSDLRGHLFAELLCIDLEYRRLSGQPTGEQHYRTQFPQYHQTIAEVFARCVLRETPQLPASLPDQHPRREMAAADVEHHVGATVADFQLLKNLGTGRTGTVWKARDHRDGRVVALKLMRPEAVSGSEPHLALREVRAAASINHPGIVRVFEAGRAGASVYIAREYIEGIDLKHLLKIRPPSHRETAKLSAEIADALQAAHEAGVVHRDLKPANVLIGAAGRPHLIDFGLAKWSGHDATLSYDDQLLGTPAYMSPEQAAGNSRLVDCRSDVYAIGVLLYECLTGELPFRGRMHELVHQIVNDEPANPRRLDGRIPRDLETICLKCLAKAPLHRYQTAAAAADDLKRWLANRPIRARRPGVIRRTGRWVRRNRSIAAGVALAAASLAAVMLVLTASNVATKKALFREAAARAREIRQRRIAERKTHEARQHLYVAHLSLVQQAWESGNVGLMRDILKEYETPARQTGDPRGFEWHYYYHLAHADEHAIHVSDVPVRWVDLSPNYAYLVAAGDDGSVSVWDLPRRKLLRRFSGHTDVVHSAAFAPDGQQIVTVSDDQTLRLSKLRDDSRGEVLLRHEMPLTHAIFSQSGEKIFFSTRLGEVGVWDVRGNRLEHMLNAHGRDVTYIAASPDGTLAASTGDDGLVVLWQTHPFQRIATLEDHGAPVYAAAFSRGGDVLATADSTGKIVAWDVATGQPRWRFEHDASVLSVAMAPEGACLAAATSAGEIVLLDAESGELERVLRGHRSQVNCVAFLADGRTLVTAGDDGTLRFWNIEQRRDLVDTGHTDTIWSVVVSPTGTLAATCSSDKSIKLWDTETGQLYRVLCGHRADVCAIAFSPDGTRLASGSDDRTVRLWDVASGRQIGVLERHADNVDAVAFDPRGNLLATAARDGEVVFWDLESRTVHASLKTHTRGLTAIAYRPDGEQLALSHRDGRLQIWETSTRKVAAEWQGHTGRVSEIRFSPTGARLATASRDGTVKIWRTPAGELEVSITADVSRVQGLSFSPDGQVLATGGGDGRVKLWAIPTGQQRATFTEHQGRVHSVAFSPDGSMLASVGEDQHLVLRHTSKSPHPHVVSPAVAGNPGRSTPKKSRAVSLQLFPPKLTESN